jgi:hypothetical protein
MNNKPYICTNKAVGLTEGVIYYNILPMGNPLNICVRNDDGDPKYFDTRKHFKEVKPVLKLVNGVWQCCCRTKRYFGIGHTPKEAYNHWVIIND